MISTPQVNPEFGTQEVTLVKPGELTSQHVDRWRWLQATNPQLANPYFCPEFTQLVGRYRDNVEVVIVEQAGEIIGFFPFERDGSSYARPVGGRLSDYQGIIQSPESHLSGKHLLKQCQLTSFDFDHLLADQAVFADYHRIEDCSPFMNFEGGFEAYREKQSKTGKKEISDANRKLRKLGREIGETRFELISDDQAAFEHVLAWKSRQYIESGLFDPFSVAWTRELMEAIWRTRNEHFAGLLSVLYAGGNIVAAHFGMRSARVLHWWFPTYNQEYSKFSPGKVLLYQLAEAAANAGLTSIDLGKGMSQYKSIAMTDSIPIAEGTADLNSVRRQLVSGYLNIKSFLKTTPLRKPLQYPARVLFRLQQARSLQDTSAR